MEQKNLDALIWKTHTLYPGPQSAELENDFQKAPAKAMDFRERYRGKVASLDGAGLLQALKEYEELEELIVKPQLYAHLLFAADSEDEVNKRLSQKAAEFGNQMSREVLFFDLEIIQLEEPAFSVLAADERLANYRHYMESQRKFRPHMLPEREETLLKQKSLTGTEAFSRLFDEVSASFRYKLELDGEEQELTGEELLGLLHHPQASVRERAFTVFLKRHEEQAIVFSTVFNTVALDHGQDQELRSYRHPMEPTNLGNEIPAEVVNRLMSVSEANYPLAQEYFRIKAKLLKMDRLKNTDVYAPLGDTTRRYTFDEARDLALAAYGRFSPAFRDMAAAFFHEGRVDALPRPGKSGGAFCMGMTPSLPPYVLLNFTGNLRDVATIAHELGHGIHFTLAQHQTMVNYHAPLPLAETASVFGEMLLTRHLLEEENDPQVKIALLCAQIEDIIATTFRQNVLTRFEERMHLERQNGLLTATRLCELWWEENARLFGDAVEMIDAYRWGWSYISHFIHARFYCYSYTFAELLVLSLYQRYLSEGEAFIPVYREILASGGSRSPANTVRSAGIDLSAPDFWQNGYDVLRDLVENLKLLIKP
ncbi:oligoendopeptidase F [Geotalea daltonii FRC-32]|uniref:Oligoendopeptidase F n=1 Tax=Geotalea daltonii (strain DSM 22248 / JCM 15807 / FRC-32) TaxID=316067 RepID=B9M3F2_GEODF|nr:M3 family oligoendopeptidase [Geotalea daltonii]ACM21373.1 oligoendopeptidase F [Geotalea daltonii FRC-32]